VFRDAAAEPDLEVVGVRAKDEKVDGMKRHGSQRCPWAPTALST
jgi:hypothetical protein